MDDGIRKDFFDDYKKKHPLPNYPIMKARIQNNINLRRDLYFNYMLREELTEELYEFIKASYECLGEYNRLMVLGQCIKRLDPKFIDLTIDFINKLGIPSEYQTFVNDLNFLWR